MDKKADESSSSAGLTVAGLVIFAIFLVFITPSISRAWSLLFAGDEDTSQSTREFYTQLVDTVTRLKEGSKTELLFSLNSDFVVVGLRKDQDSFLGSCQGVSLDIKKQLRCNGKGCICLCEKSTFTKEICSSEGDVCNSFEFDVVDSKSDCDILFVKPNVVTTLAVTRDKTKVDVNSLNSRELAD